MTRATGFLCVLAAFFVLPNAGAHERSCTPTAADPSTYTVVDLQPAGGDVYYVEDRGAGNWMIDPPITPPPPGWGFFFGDGTSAYQESNDIPGLQRGGLICFPSNVHQALPCLIMDEQVPSDQTCGQGPDRLIF
jgi:hypothetical protein